MRIDGLVQDVDPRSSESSSPFLTKTGINGWENRKLADLIDLVYGSSLSKEVRKLGGYPVYGSNGIVGYHEKALVEGPGIIIGRKGSIGKITWCNEDFWPIDTTYYVERKIPLDFKWIYYKLISLNLEKLNSATGIPGLNRGDVFSLNVQVPTIPEQRKIAAILSFVDAAIEQTDAIITQTERMKTGLMQELFTKGVAHKEFKKTSLGLIPDNWKIKTIDELKGKNPHAISMGPFGSNIKTDNFISSGIPVIRGVNLASLFVSDFNFVYISEKKADELIASNAYPRDIVITHRGTIGQVSIIPDSAKHPRYVVSQSQMKLTCDESIVDPYFLNYYLNSPKGQYLLLRNKAYTGVPALGQPTTSLKDILVPIPDIGEQKLISSVLSSAIDRIQVEQRYLETLKLLKRGLMQDLLTGRVRVKVDGNV